MYLENSAICKYEIKCELVAVKFLNESTYFKKSIEKYQNVFLHNYSL